MVRSGPESWTHEINTDPDFQNTFYLWFTNPAVAFFAEFS